jgi:L-fuconate dehydratase
MIDYVCISASKEGRVLEFVDHLHQHFLDPVVIRDGRYIAPVAPGYSITMHPESIAAHAFPHGSVWLKETAERRAAAEAKGVGASAAPKMRDW